MRHMLIYDRPVSSRYKKTLLFAGRDPVFAFSPRFFFFLLFSPSIFLYTDPFYTQYCVLVRHHGGHPFQGDLQCGTHPSPWKSPNRDHWPQWRTPEGQRRRIDPGRYGAGCQVRLQACVQARVWIPVDLLLRRQHQWCLCHHHDHTVLPARRRWQQCYRVVLADLRCWLYVYCGECLVRKSQVGLG